MAGFSLRQQDNFSDPFEVAITASQILKDECYWIINKMNTREEMLSNRKTIGFDMVIMDDYFRKTGVYCIKDINIRSFMKAYMHCAEKIEQDITGVKRAIIFGKKFKDDETYHEICKEKRMLEADNYLPIKIRTLQHTEECISCKIQ